MVPKTTAPTDVAGFNPAANAGNCWYDEDAAEDAVKFISQLSHTKGKWAREKNAKVKLELWQLAFVRSLFGWKRPDGTRRFSSAFLFIPRKNGKSFLAAAIALYVLFMDKEPEAECYCAAGSRDQAALVFKQAASMIRKAPALDKRSRVLDATYRIVHDGSFIRAISADDGTAHGFSPHLIIGDELHVWPNRHLYETLHTGIGARDQPLEIYITTAGHDRQSICYEVYQRACAVRDGTIEDDSLLPAIYEASETDDWENPATWKKANPNYGVSVNERYLREEAKKARENPAYENTFKRLHLNVWTATDKRWIPLGDWDNCHATDDVLKPHEAVWCGLDLSSVRDFSAFATVAKRDGVLRTEVTCWAPADRIEFLEREHNISCQSWIRDGWLVPCRGGTIHQTQILEHIRSVIDRHDVQSIGYDPYNAHAVWQPLQEEHGEKFMVVYRQGLGSMSAPTKAMETAILDGRIDHGGNPLLRWMIDNTARTEPDKANNYMVTKVANKVHRHIDGIVALIMAIGEAEAGVAEVASGFDSEWNFG
jgi:phage terminase large subunit-like protein